MKTTSAAHQTIWQAQLESAQTVALADHVSEVPFDRLLSQSDPIDGMVVHVWAKSPLLSLGLRTADPCHCPFHSAAPGNVLALHHSVGRVPWRQCVHCGGSAAGCDSASRGNSGIRPRSRVETLETQILDNPSAGNYEELGELYMELKQFRKAQEAFDRAIAARSDSPHTFYFRAQCLLAQNNFSEAIPDLERVVEGDRKFDYYRAAGLLADAYAKTGDMERSGLLFAEVTQYSTTPETLYNYANYLKLQNRGDEAREWVQKLLAKKRTLPRYMGRIERPWFRKGKALLKELATA